LADKYQDFLKQQQQQQNRHEDNNSGIGPIGLGLIGAAAYGAGRIFAPGVTKAVSRGLIRVAAAGTNAGLGAMSYVAKSGIGNKFKMAGGFVSAIDHALEQRNPLSLMADQTGRFNQRFRDSFSRSLDTMNRRASSTLKGLPTQIEQQYHEHQKSLAHLGSDMQYKAFQYNAVINELKHKMPQHFNDQGLETILNQRNHEFYSQPSAPKIEELLTMFSKKNAAEAGHQFHIDLPEHKHDDFVGKMLDTLNRYSTRKNHDKNTLFKLRKGAASYDNYDGLEIGGMVNFRNQMTDDLIESRKAKRNSFMDKVQAKLGYRPALVRDMLKQNADGKWENHLFDVDSITDIHNDNEKLFNNKATIYNKNMGNKFAALANKKDGNRWLDSTIDNLIYINDKGHIRDMRTADKGLYKAAEYIQKNFKIPFLNFNPLDLMHFTTYQSIRETPKTYFLGRGTIHPFANGLETLPHPFSHNQDAAAGPLAKDYIYSNNKIYDVMTGKVVKKDVYLASGRFGMVPRVATSMANLHRPLPKRGFFKTLFDIGGQENENEFQRFGSMFTKFSDEDWERNTLSLMFNPDYAHDPEFREKAYKKLYSTINQHVRPLSDRTVDYLSGYAKRAYGDTNIDLGKLNTPDEVRAALGRIVTGINDKSSGLAGDEIGNQLLQTYHYWNSNPTQFLNNKRIVGDHSSVFLGPLQTIDPRNSDLVSKLDDVKRLIHQHAVKQIMHHDRIPIGEIVKRGIQSGDLLDSATGEVRDLSVLSNLQGHWKNIYIHTANKEEELKDFFKNTTDLSKPHGQNLYNTIDSHSSVFSAGPGERPPQHQGYINYTVMNKARGHRWWLENFNEQIKQGKEPIKALGSSLWGVLGQPFAGRKNLGDVSTATLPFYYMFERMDNGLGKVGLGLSQKNRGSMQSIFANQFMRRIVLPYVAVKQLEWFDDSTNNVGSNALSDAYAQVSMGMAKVKDVFGINTFEKSFTNLFPGLDQLGKTPIGGLLKYGTFGLIGDTRSQQEMEDYYTDGTDEVRHGRWWGIGSNTPWEGGKIDYFQPNWYRRQKAHYKDTDVLYGSAGERWANSPMPTLSHPLAPLRHFIFDPNHYANKHEDDRPYPVTGGVDELNMIPFIGGGLNKLLYGEHKRGDLSKAHRQYLSDVNDYYKSQYEATTQGGYIETMPAGGTKLMAKGGGFGSGFGEGMSSYITPDGLDMSSTTDPANLGPGVGGSGGITDFTSLSKAELTAINLGFTKGIGLSPARSITSLDSLRDPDTIADLKDLNTPGSVGSILGGADYSLTEVGGMYGFAKNALLQSGNKNLAMALDTSQRMTSYSRSYYDKNLGGADGMGGEFSEIFRRYNPKDPRKQYYNPYKNKMPDWMPGVNYFIDFQHGDPFVKIPKGEMRLPGGGYESLNRLHPDQFGDYGAFDRFKILADVAPYSDEYKFWRRIISQENAQGMLDDQGVKDFASIRDQVGARKDKYHLYPYKFSNANVIKKDVTITQVLDENTYLTDMDPLHPIRLAGVHVPVGADNAKAWLSQFIHEGAKLTIGIDADPLNRVHDDKYQTIRAVVYSNGHDDSEWYQSTKGQSLNAILARRSFGDKDKVKVREDGTGVSTAALYDQSQITVGKLMEWVTHSAVPQIPVLGVFADKFMQVRSPLEMYKRNEVYGKAWRPWNEPYEGWIKPMVQTITSRNPLIAAAEGYGIGRLFGRGKGAYIGKWVGALSMGTLASIRSIDEFTGEHLPGGDHYASIPGRRKKERELNEYFDTLKYMKFRGLYEKTKQEAKRYEGIDIEQVLNDSENRGSKNKQSKKQLATMKKWLSITEKLGYVDQDIIDEQLKKAQDRVNAIGEDKGLVEIGPYAMQAMQYRAEYESTLYGADENGDMTKIYKALPKKDREFFQQFMTANPKEREEILRLVPKNERRFYEAKWGMDVEKVESLPNYFQSHFLPGKDWEGWRPDVNLDNIKIKVAKNEGVDFTEFGMWPDDEQRANDSGVQAINPNHPSMSIDPLRIEKVLRGAGLTDVSVNMTSTPHHENVINMSMNFIKDRSNDIINGINQYMGQLV
jgi:hypothetical protein